ncbi:hypothetical protein M3A49_08430 [Paraburkholderia sp. CNPSo 3076]|uniref:hypothetical protein n=1 Tax=Paraburkholderia sp. CNPSo 3076 TaxID=2940936 RepID=UPI00225483FB|nr:hypothetical protein [Paraburkholderia sp. CNPSo 3076]MCX5539514.1 hypothetical protein [Paraburkholderia sp. CNPSo 3076]
MIEGSVRLRSASASAAREIKVLIDASVGQVREGSALGAGTPAVAGGVDFPDLIVLFYPQLS